MEPAGRAHFGTLLRQLRLDAGMTQQDLAERSRLSVEAISTLERGARTRPHTDTLTLLARALNWRRSVTRAITSFVGRGRELDELAVLLQKNRLVTITGAGGVGKTRIAVQLCEQIRDDHRDSVQS